MKRGLTREGFCDTIKKPEREGLENDCENSNQVTKNVVIINDKIADTI